jgi:hypothetical protein
MTWQLVSPGSQLELVGCSRTLADGESRKRAA